MPLSQARPGSGQAPAGAGAGVWPLSLLQAMSAPLRAHTTLCLCGDIMTAHGIDPLLPPGEDRLPHARSMRSALEYVRAAEADAPLPRPVCFEYPWGDVLALLKREQPDLRLVNLEACITARGNPACHRLLARLSPQQLPMLVALGAHGALLANPHALGWGLEGLDDTLSLLRQAGIAAIGAGHDRVEAEQDAQWLLPGKARVRLFAFGHPSGGLSGQWAAGDTTPGVSWLERLDGAAVATLARRIRGSRRDGDIVLVALHWGGQGDAAVSAEQRQFARALIDEAGVDLVWGNASRHPRPIEVHRGRLILYGVGKFLKDPGGGSDDPALRPDLAALYLPRLCADGRLAELRLWPLRVHLFRLKRACASDCLWLARALGDACRCHGTGLEPLPDGSLRLYWS